MQCIATGDCLLFLLYVPSLGSAHVQPFPALQYTQWSGSASCEHEYTGNAVVALPRAQRTGEWTDAFFPSPRVKSVQSYPALPYQPSQPAS